MPRLRNRVTGAVMSVQESTAARLGGEWVPADLPDETEPVFEEAVAEDATATPKRGKQTKTK